MPLWSGIDGLLKWWVEARDRELALDWMRDKLPNWRMCTLILDLKTRSQQETMARIIYVSQQLRSDFRLYGEENDYHQS